jgi:50S ribosomal protein L16 3-hydroxylase
MESRYTLSPEFWAQFAERHWEKKPLVLKKPFSAQLVASKEVFQTLVNPGSREQEDWGFRFYIERALQEAEVAKHLPAPIDGSLSGYAERVSFELKGRQFALVVDHYHKHDVQTWLRLRDFLRGLYGVVGVPVPLSVGAVFVSNNERSPFGIHKDGHSAFTFVVEGGKRILAWPDEVFRNRPDVWGSLDYARFRKEAIILEGKPGDLIYWPSSYWHVAESIGGFSVTLAVPVFPQFNAGSDVFSHVTKTIESRLKTTEEML